MDLYGGVVDVVSFEGGDALGDVRGGIGDGLERAEFFDSTSRAMVVGRRGWKLGGPRFVT